MNIVPPVGKSMTAHLTDILKSAFPQTAVTGLARHMTRIRPDPTSKGKAVQFIWEKREFRLTANCHVREYSWGFEFPNCMHSNDETAAIEKALESALTPAPQPVQEAPQAWVFENSPRLLLPAHIDA